MTTNQNSTTTRRTAIRRLIAGMILGAAPLLIAVDTAAAHADTTVSTPGPSFHSPAYSLPVVFLRDFEVGFLKRRKRQ